MSQSRSSSLLEQCLSTASGFILSMCVWAVVIVPLWNVPIRFIDNLAITSIFTVVSIIRGYVWRRVFVNFFRG